MMIASQPSLPLTMLLLSLLKRFRTVAARAHTVLGSNGGGYRVAGAMVSGRAGSAGSSDRLVWVDCEMTGLDPERDRLLEVAVMVTDGNLKPVGAPVGLELVIHQPDSVLESMNEWCRSHHSASGLVDRVKESRLSVGEAEARVLEFLQPLTPPGVCPMAGNSVGQDARFLYKYMPGLMQHLHYRIVDVSTVKELCRRWYPDVVQRAPPKALAHRALADIRDSIEELKFYRQEIFRRGEDGDPPT